MVTYFSFNTSSTSERVKRAIDGYSFTGEVEETIYSEKLTLKKLSSGEKQIVFRGGCLLKNIGILDGTVIDVLEDDIMGQTVKIKHSNDLISIYQSLSDIRVKINDNVVQGTIIGLSGDANISPELGNHLHFELCYQGSVVNPENYYDKLLGELK